MAVIDADAHVLETRRTWEYLRQEEREFRPQIIETPGMEESGGECWLIDGRLHPKGRNVGKETPKESREMDDIGARIRHMDELGVDVQVLYPTVFLRPFTKRAEMEAALYRSYNRWLADIYKQGRGRLRWIVLAPLLNMDQALEEARFGKENGACGIFMRGLEGEKRLSDPFFFPLYDEADRLDMPICVHSATGSFTLHDFFSSECGFSKFKLAVVGAFHSLLFDGIPERFPNTRFAFIEVSSQWVPYALHDLAKRFARRGRHLSKSVLRENRIYVACQTDDDLAYVLGYAGEDNIVIGSDYGHADTSSEIAALRNLKTQSDVRAEVIDKILDSNPRSLYHV